MKRQDFYPLIPSLMAGALCWRGTWLRVAATILTVLITYTIGIAKGQSQVWEVRAKYRDEDV